MKSISRLFLAGGVLCSLFLSSGCESDPNALFNLEKRYWDVDDYKNALSLIQNTAQNGHKIPSYSSQTPVFLKLVDVNNFTAVLDDKELGVKHRTEFSEKMFEVSRDMDQVYTMLDSQDKYPYSSELVDVMNFSFLVQVYYFRLGNENIKKTADNPDAEDIKSLVRRNEQTLIDNCTNDLDYVNRESAFTQEALVKYAEGIDKNISLLLTEFPSVDYSSMLEKANLMLKKAESKEVKDALTKISSQLEAKVHPPKAEPSVQDSTAVIVP